MRAAYDGVWASACLLHVPRDELAGVLARIHRALKPEGLFYASYKVGHGDGRDSFGRYYNYPPRSGWMRPTPLRARGLQSNRTPARSRALTRRQRSCCTSSCASAKPRAHIRLLDTSGKSKVALSPRMSGGRGA